MNTSQTDNGKAYEYDRNGDLIGMVYVSREWLDGQRPRKEWGWKTFIGLSLVFAGVVLWKVWR